MTMSRGVRSALLRSGSRVPPVHSVLVFVMLVVCMSFVTSFGTPDARAFQGAPRFIRSQLTWFDRTGKKLGVVGGMADYGNVELSPAGDRVGAAVVSDAARGTRSIWLIDVATGTHTVLTSDGADANWMLWSSDGRRVMFNSGRNGGLDLYQASSTAPGKSPDDPVLIDREAKWPVSWSTDGRYLLYVINGQRTGNDIFVLPLFGDRKPFPFKQTTDSENWAAFSPDGKWVAYSSTEAGDPEVYVSPFPPVASPRRWLVSKGGGTQARWRRDGKELYFLSPDRTIVAAAVTVHGADFEVGAMEPLFAIRLPYGQYHAFDVTADGQRFLVNTLVTQPGSSVIAH
jgi:Tol biopolymer transport system component